MHSQIFSPFFLENVLSFWNVLVYTTPSTSKLWSCLSFLGVPTMQIRPSEVQIFICGDKE